MPNADGAYRCVAITECDSLASDPAELQVCFGCVGDATRDCQVTLADLATLLPNMGRSGMTPDQGDFSGDGRVALENVAMLLAAFGRQCDCGRSPETPWRVVAREEAGRLQMLDIAGGLI